MSSIEPGECTEAADLAGDGESPKRRRAIVVLGMHRSGTSAVSGCLQRLGVEFGPRLMPPTLANERGYYEHIDVVNLHDRLLMALGRGWDTLEPWPAGSLENEALTARFRAELLGVLQRDFGSSPLWGIKDPRLCRLLPWWRPLWSALETEPIFVIVVRHPREVADSLARRDGVSPTKSFLLWTQHMLDAERETRGCARLFLSFNDFVENWSGSLSPLATLLGPSWTTAMVSGREAVGQFLDGGLRRASAPANEASGLPAALEEVYRWFASRCRTAVGSTPPVFDEHSVAEMIAHQPPAERLSDAAVELAAARKLAAWYETEWQKARARAGKYQHRLEKRAASPKHRPDCIIANERSISIQRKRDIAFLRKSARSWLLKIVDFFAGKGGNVD